MYRIREGFIHKMEQVIREETRETEGAGPAAEGAKPLMSVRGVEREFHVGGQRIHVLKGIDMELLPGQLVMLRGRSGSGKTTLLNLLGGLDVPTKGEIIFKDRPLHRFNDDERTAIRRKEIGFIFQAYALMPLLSAWENVELSLRIAGVPKRLHRELAERALTAVGLKARMNHRPFELSGGEQQRVALARSLVSEPRLLLADEPFGALDALTRIRMHDLLRRLCQRHRPAVLLVTHDVDEAVTLADRVLVLDAGRITVETTIDLSTPRSPRDPEFQEYRERLLAALGVTHEGASR